MRQKSVLLHNPSFLRFEKEYDKIIIEIGKIDIYDENSIKQHIEVDILDFDSFLYAANEFRNTLVNEIFSDKIMDYHMVFGKEKDRSGE